MCEWFANQSTSNFWPSTANRHLISLGFVSWNSSRLLTIGFNRVFLNWWSWWFRMHAAMTISFSFSYVYFPYICVYVRWFSPFSLFPFVSSRLFNTLTPTISFGLIRSSYEMRNISARYIYLINVCHMRVCVICAPSQCAYSQLESEIGISLETE